MGKHYYNFELDFNKIDAQDICNVLDKMQCVGSEHKHEVDYVQWNIFGNFIFYGDGDNCSYYFTKHYLRVKGWDLLNKDEIDRGFKCLKELCE